MKRDRLPTRSRDRIAEIAKSARSLSSIADDLRSDIDSLLGEVERLEAKAEETKS